MASSPFSCQTELVRLFDALVEVIFCAKNDEGRYVEANTAFVRRTGQTSKRQVIGFRATDLFSAPQANRYEAQDQRVFATGRALRDEMELIRRVDGSLGWYLTTKLPVASATAHRMPVGLVSVSRDLSTPSDDYVAAHSLTRVVTYVRDYLNEPIRVANLAAVAQCSTSQLERRMRNAFGTSAAKYVTRARVDRASELLATTDLPLATVAARSGFYDQAGLTRAFARFSGDTPGQFRARNQP